MKNLLSLVYAAVVGLVHLLHVGAAFFALRSVEIQLNDRRKIMETITDPLELKSLQASYALTVREAEEANAKYNALLPVGRRHVLHVPA